MAWFANMPGMNDRSESVDLISPYRTVLALPLLFAFLRWVAQPPLGIWPVVFICLTPLFALIGTPHSLPRRSYLVIWFAGSFFWLIALQGLRHAHPAVFLCLFALSFYLGTYVVIFVALLRWCHRKAIPMILSAPALWVGIECWRNYFATGLSALMLGHSLANQSTFIQIADLFGTYGVSFVIVCVNVAAFAAWQLFRKQISLTQAGLSFGPTIVIVSLTLVYGTHRIGESTDGESLSTFSLIQRSEVVEYQQSADRESEIFSSYLQGSIAAIRTAELPVDAIVWPESMFTGGLPWMIADANASAPPGFQGSTSEFPEMVRYNQKYFNDRARDVMQTVVRGSRQPDRFPELIVGCSVVRYADVPRVYSGIVHLSENIHQSSGEPMMPKWYGKTHLVMFGEYIPILPYIPGIKSYLPPGLGVTPGDGAQAFHVSDTVVVPNICIETAIERVAINHIGELLDQGEKPDCIVTVTNDGWFDDSSVVEHHLRCAQLVAVGARRPILSAANNGPTAWIDHKGRIVERLPVGVNGHVIANPKRCSRISPYVAIGDLPAKALGLIVLILGVLALNDRRLAKRDQTD